jgi:autotransporter-associated beta strand protein
MNILRIQFPLLMAALGLAVHVSSFAASYTWDSDANAAAGSPAATTPGSGTWDGTVANWNLAGSAVTDGAWVSGSDAVFAGSDGTYSINVGSSLSVNNITFSNSGYTLSAASAVTLSGTAASNLVTVASGATATIGNNVTFTSGFNAVTISLVGTAAANGTAGTLVIDSGGKVSATFGSTLIYIGSNTNTANSLKATTVEVKTGGTISSNASVVVNGLLKVDGGTVNAVTGIVAIGNFADANMPASAVLTINSGTVSAATGVRFGTSTSQLNTGGTLNLNGGTLTTPKITSGGTSNSSTVNFNGGTLKASATNNTDFFGTAATPIKNAIVKAGGAVIDTNAFDVTIFTALTHDSVLGSTMDGGLTKVSSGTLTLSGNNTYTGLTDVQAGTLRLGRSGGTIADTAAVRVSGGILDVANSDTVGAVTLSSGTISGVGTLTGSSYSLTNTGTVSAALGGSGSLSKTGAGTAILSGSNAYTGTTTVSAGTLQVSGSIVSSATTVGSGATLALSGSGSAGAVTVNSGTFQLGTAGTAGAVTINDGTFGGVGTVSSLTFTGASTFGPGNSPGTVTVADGGTFSLSNNTISTFQFTDSGFGVGTFDLLTTSGTVSGTIAGTLNLDFTGTDYTAGTSVTFIDLTSISGTFSTINVTGLDSGLVANVIYNNVTGDVSLSLVAASSVPEPSTYAAILGASVLGFVAFRRRRVVGR